MKHNICIVTGTRAEYHLLHPLIVALQKEPAFHVMLAVTGAHLSERQGNTWRDIEKDGIQIDAKIPILGDGDSESDINHAMSRAIDGFDAFFHESRPELVIILGDRYEMLSVAIVCMNMRIPIAHIYGGETTEGLIDESIRHSITKMSYLHFTSTEQYKNRVIQMGESPDRVYCVGAIGVENAIHTELMSKRMLEESIGFELGEKYAVGTFHPVTLEEETALAQVNELLDAISFYPNIKFLFTMANADSGGNIINNAIRSYAKEHDHFKVINSLGVIRYFSAIRDALFVIGNSSSGLVEVPSFHIPTINIGDRQRGRIAGETVIHCDPCSFDIQTAIEKAMTDSFKRKCEDARNPYGDGKVTKKIIPIIESWLCEGKMDLKKKFYTILS
ncbi:MAG: UDP-N-acetylglucosamine 2-epimerase (hydrolyzing) [Lachnospiraceae bacterium]|nr:UDP-N-acetylglucosamine 2-epimerase (hydrolyzing) [Lachnospiraceae bacterium]